LSRKKEAAWQGGPKNTDTAQVTTGRRQPRLVTICCHCGAAQAETLRAGHGWFVEHALTAHGITSRTGIAARRRRAFERRLELLEELVAERRAA
jgi:hypothetical protein